MRYEKHYRAIQEESLSEAIPIFIRAYAEPPWNERWSINLAQSRLNELFEHPRYMAIGAFSQDTLAGFAVGTPHTGVAGCSLYLAELVVDPLFQRQGLGRALLTEFEQYAIRADYQSIWLVTERIESTADFYSKSGFRCSDRLSVLSKRLDKVSLQPR